MALDPHCIDQSFAKRVHLGIDLNGNKITQLNVKLTNKKATSMGHRVSYIVENYQSIGIRPVVNDLFDLIL